MLFFLLYFLSNKYSLVEHKAEHILVKYKNLTDHKLFELGGVFILLYTPSPQVLCGCLTLFKAESC